MKTTNTQRTVGHGLLHYKVHQYLEQNTEAICHRVFGPDFSKLKPSFRNGKLTKATLRRAQQLLNEKLSNN